MSDTPRTEAITSKYCQPPETVLVPSDFARQLERELDAAIRDSNQWQTQCEVARIQRDALTKQRDELNESIHGLFGDLSKAREDHQILYEQTGKDLYEARKQRDRLADAGRNLCMALLVKEPRNLTYLINQVGEAIASVKPDTSL